MKKFFSSVFLSIIVCFISTVFAESTTTNIDELSTKFNDSFYNLPDEFSNKSGGIAAIFIKKGDDFVRVSTSLKKANGTKAVGTELGKKNPAYHKLMKGENYEGDVMLFGKNYHTKYVPIKDTNGNVVGILAVGAPAST